MGAREDSIKRLKAEHGGSSSFALFDFWVVRGDDGSARIDGLGEYSRTSVLAGSQQTRRGVLEYASVDEALREYPGLEVMDREVRIVPGDLPHCPPEDFDPMDCGERWDDDY